MDTPKVAAPQHSRNPDCPSCSKPMYRHRGRFLCSDSATCGRVFTPDRLDLARHLEEAAPPVIELPLI